MTQVASPVCHTTWVMERVTRPRMVSWCLDTDTEEDTVTNNPVLDARLLPLDTVTDNPVLDARLLPLDTVTDNPVLDARLLLDDLDF